MKKTVATIKTATNVNTAGIVAQTWAGSTTAAGVWLPTGGEKAQQIYGVIVPCEFTFFTRSRSALLIAGNRLEIASLQYEILYVADYTKIQSVLVRKVI